MAAPNPAPSSNPFEFVKLAYTHVVDSFKDLIAFNKVATLIVMAVSFAAGALLF